MDLEAFKRAIDTARLPSAGRVDVHQLFSNDQLPISIEELSFQSSGDRFRDLQSLLQSVICNFLYKQRDRTEPIPNSLFLTFHR
jgi:hypothetical protein